MKRFFALILLTLLGTATFASDTPQTVRIKTSAICKMCKARIERQLGYTKGVTDASLDLKDKVVTVTYNPKKTDTEQLKRAINEVGYDADALPANPKSYDKLPKCCKKGTPDHAD
jgi:mercuric ion binding protein